MNPILEDMTPDRGGAAGPPPPTGTSPWRRLERMQAAALALIVSDTATRARALADLLAEMAGIPFPDLLSVAQVEGRACVWCGGEEGPMLPVMGGPVVAGTGQLFAHQSCRPSARLAEPDEGGEGRKL